LIGGQSGNTILDTLYELTSISGTWKIVSKLQIPRCNFASWTITTNLLSDCSVGEIMSYAISYSTLKNNSITGYFLLVARTDLAKCT